MGQVLIVSGSQEDGEVIVEMLKNKPFKRLLLIAGASQAKHYLQEESFELLIINTPLKDEFGYDIALHAVSTTNAGVLLVVQPEEVLKISLQLERYGVFVIAKPLNQAFFDQVLRVMKASYYRLLRLQEENLELHKKIKDIHLVHRAKCALMQYLDMSEDQAHKYIERQAMDQRVNKREVAKGILRSYESEG